MPAEARFQIVRFGSRMAPVFSAAPVVMASDATLAQATAVLAVRGGTTRSQASQQRRTIPPTFHIPQAMDADLGGTQLLEPLEVALTPATRAALMLEGPSAAGPGAAAAPQQTRILGEAPRNVFLFTDGEVGNTREVIAAVREAAAANGTRVHCFGVGSGVPTELVQVGRAGR